MGSMVMMSAVSAHKVAAVGVKAMRKGRREVIPGLMNKPMPLITRLTPVRMQLAIMDSVLK
jgi:short-subunit dehydrogenase